MYLPITDKDKARCHKYGSKKLEGILMGYSQRSVGSCDGDLPRSQTFTKSTTPTALHQIYPKRFKAKEIHPVMIGFSEVIFPLALQDHATNPGNDHDHSNDPQHQHTTTEVQVPRQHRPHTTQTTTTETTNLPIDNVFGEITSELLIRHHLTPRRKLFMPDEKTMSTTTKLYRRHAYHQDRHHRRRRTQHRRHVEYRRTTPTHQQPGPAPPSFHILRPKTTTRQTRGSWTEKQRNKNPQDRQPSTPKSGTTLSKNDKQMSNLRMEKTNNHFVMPRRLR